MKKDLTKADGIEPQRVIKKVDHKHVKEGGMCEWKQTGE